jgi:hypothetical protein
MSSLQRISRLARLGRWTVYATLAGVVAARLAQAWILAGGEARVGGVGMDFDTALPYSWAQWTVDALAALVLILGLWRLLRLLRCYEQGQPFRAETAGHLRAFALSVMGSVLLQRGLPLLLAALGVEAFGLPHLVLPASELWTLLTSGLFLLITQVMVQAQHLAEDNEQIV